MRLGWALLPSWLAWPLIQAKAVEDGGSEAIGQLALHDFIERGELDRHIRRMRLRYQRRREALLDALARHLPEARVSAGAAGLYELVELPDEVDEAGPGGRRGRARSRGSRGSRCTASIPWERRAWFSASPACPRRR